MVTPNRLEALEAANRFISKNFPNSQGALLAGSVVRNQKTTTSDLDIVVFDSSLKSSYRESRIEFGWPVEVFAHNLISYKDFFKSDCERARPSMPRMVSEGIVLKDEGVIESIKNEADQLLQKGPEEWSPEKIRSKIYFITDSLDDLIGCSDRAEEIFITNTLAELVSEFVLRTNKQWIGTSKWIIRSLKTYDQIFTKQFVDALDTFYKNGEKDKIIKLVDQVLQPHGGRLFEGFSIGKK